MARVQCAISGISFLCEHLPIMVEKEAGYFHPVFALPYSSLYVLYGKHCGGHLSDTDSYLLFLAFLQSTDKVIWKTPVNLNPTDLSTIRLIDTNIHALIKAIEVSYNIDHPVFKQPYYKVSKSNADLSNIGSYIKAWNKNIAVFNAGYINHRERTDILRTEDKLSIYIKSGAKLESYPHVVATWADKVGHFPRDKKALWIRTIRSCFNTNKMFNTPLTDLKELKAYCEENIDVGTIHFHTLMKVLKEGIGRHIDFLGMSPIGLGYQLLDSDTSKNDMEVEVAIASAPKTKPIEAEYKSKIEYLKANLRYMTAEIYKSKETNIETETGESL